MTVFDWVLIGWWVLSALCFVAYIGKPRPPIAPGDAVLRIVVVVGFIVALLWSRGVL